MVRELLLALWYLFHNMKRVRVIQARLRQVVRNELFLAGIVFLVGLFVFFFELFMQWFPAYF